MEPFVQVERATIQWLVQSYQRRTLRRAVRQAYANFAIRYPQWVAALFDEHFVYTHLLPMLQGAAQRGDKVTPVEVTETWARQISIMPSLRQQHMARMIPAATHFLCMVAEELAKAQVGQNSDVLVETATG
jgi:hypothetical protein